MTRAKIAAIGTAALLMGGAAAVGVNQATNNSSPAVAPAAMGCNDWEGEFTQKECFASGALLYSLSNFTNSAQFCKWQPANPGEWNRLRAYASSAIAPSQGIVTWFGAGLLIELQSYFATGAPVFDLHIDQSIKNRCRTPLAPPSILGVTPGQTQATVTLGP